MRRLWLLLLSLGGFLGLVANAQSDDWPAFRGPRGDGVSNETRVPLNWDATSGIHWKVALPAPGNGSPIVAENRVWIAGTNADSTERGLYCYDRNGGRLVWSRMVPFAGEDPTHRTNPYCSSTPVTDGRRVVVWHGSAGVYCYDLAGMELWHRDLGTFKHIWGYGSSPLISGDRLLL
ncbi:MAG: PQQ-binding-like beta-propeller repeat protein, partial [Planctomycetota bacterium]|nr:PQQ-binding-like beta-propeller repeat protein [Planctomycetota bacterium]